MPNPLPLSPLQLKEHGFTTVHIEAVKDGSPDAAPDLTPTIWYEQQPANPNQWRLVLALKLCSQDPAKPFTYHADIKVQGLVEVKDGFLQERKEQLALVNGFSILYSAAREMLLNVTSRSVFGAVTLPTLSFVNLVKEAIQAKNPPAPPAAQPAAQSQDSPAPVTPAPSAPEPKAQE